MKLEFKIIADLLEENTRILDVGCGTGVFWKKNRFWADKIIVTCSTNNC